jgi:hypothetical protein
MIKLKPQTRLLSEEAYIQEGCAPTDDLLMVACTVGDDYDDPQNEVVLFSSDYIFRFGFAGETLVSIDWHTDGSAYAMGEEGSVIRFTWRDIDSERELKDSRELLENEQAAETGPMRRLRVIDGTPLCVGSFGQVYSVTQDDFELFPFLDIYDDEVTIKDVAGSSLKDIVAVTQQGHAARYDGKQWIDLCLPTNMKLSGVTRLNNGEYAIVGSGGNLFIGKKDRWAHHYVDDTTRDYYGVACHDPLIYMAHIGGVDVFNGDEIEEITYDDKSGLEFAYLSKGNNSCVWAFCGSTIGCITDRKWSTISREEK